MKAKIYNLIVLDKSGSMHSIADLAIGGVNETIGTIKSDNKQNAENAEQFVSLYAFCRCDSRYIMQNVPAEEATVIDTKDYMPCCGTPLYDSLGKSLNDLYNLIKEDKNATASVTIITDGYENSSKKWSAPKTHQQSMTTQPSNRSSSVSKAKVGSLPTLAPTTMLKACPSHCLSTTT